MKNKQKVFYLASEQHVIWNQKYIACKDTGRIFSYLH